MSKPKRIAFAALLASGAIAPAHATAPVAETVQRSSQAADRIPSDDARGEEPAYANWISLAMLAAAGFALWYTMRRDRRAVSPKRDSDDPFADESFEARVARKIEALNVEEEPIVRPPPGSFGRRGR